MWQGDLALNQSHDTVLRLQKLSKRSNYSVFQRFKGSVHPNITKVSIFDLSQVVSWPYSFYLSMV